MKKTMLFFFLWSGWNQVAFSAEASVIIPAVRQEASGDELKALIREGDKLFHQGVPGTLPSCTSCHGANGEGQLGSTFPRLANQGKFYLMKTLKDYQHGARSHLAMSPIAKLLKEEQIEAVAAYLDQVQPPAYLQYAKISAPMLVRGQKLSDVGDAKLELQACGNCHGPSGLGEPPAIPYLAGQNPAYLETQLLYWKNGARKTSPEHMAVISKKLSVNDQKAVSLYFANAFSAKIKDHAPGR